MFTRDPNDAATRRTGAALVLVVIMGLVAAACEKSQLLAPTQSTLSVSAAATNIASSGSTQVQAMVLEQAGTPVQNGTTVRFVTNLGRLDPVEAQTRNGVATTTFYGDGGSGIALVRAVSGSASGGDDAANTVEIAVGSGGVDEVSVDANPSKVPVSGGTVEIIATVTGLNNAALSGVVVTFSTNAGTLSSTTATTNAAGEAKVLLTTNRSATVTARVGSDSDTVEVTILTAATVSLSAGSAIVGQPMTLTVTPADGTAPRVVIAWGDGSETDLGIVSAARTVTHVYGDSGSFAITATARDNGDTFTNSVTVTVAPRPSPTVAVVPATGVGTTATNFVFTVTPPAGGAGIRNVTIDFGDGSELSLGAITSATAVNHQFTSAGTYTVRVTLTDGSGAETFGIVVVTVS